MISVIFTVGVDVIKVAAREPLQGSVLPTNEELNDGSYDLAKMTASSSMVMGPVYLMALFAILPPDARGSLPSLV